MAIGSMKADAAAAEVVITIEGETSRIEAFPRGGRNFHENSREWGKQTRYEIQVSADGAKHVVSLLETLANGQEVVSAPFEGISTGDGGNTVMVTAGDRESAFIFTSPRPGVVSVRYLVDGKTRACGFYSKESVLALVSQFG